MPINSAGVGLGTRKERENPMAKKNGSVTKAPRRYRDALTGRFVTKKYAKKNRKTTLKEVTTRI